MLHPRSAPCSVTNACTHKHTNTEQAGHTNGWDAWSFTCCIWGVARCTDTMKMHNKAMEIHTEKQTNNNCT